MKAKIFDRFGISSEIVGIQRASGVVVIVQTDELAGQIPRVGTRMTLRSTDSTVLSVVVAETKTHGHGISFFFPGLSPADVPIGSELEWQEVKTAAPTH